MTSHGWESGIEQRSALGGRYPLGWSVRTLVPLGRFTPSPTQAPLDTENTLQRRAAEIVGLPPELGDGSAFTTFSADVETVLTTVPDRAIQPLPLPEPPVTVAEPPEPISRDVPGTATAPIDLLSGSSDRTTVSAEPIPPETFPPPVQPVQRQPLGQSQPLGFQKPELSTQASFTSPPDLPDVIPQTPSPSSQPSSPSPPSTPSPQRPVSLQPDAPSDPAAVIDSDTFPQLVLTPETVQTVEESTETDPPSEAASPVEPLQSTDTPPPPPPDSTEAALPVVTPTATPDSTQAALPSPSQTRPSQTSAQDIAHRQPLEHPLQKPDTAIPDATDKVQTPATIQSKDNGLGTENLERLAPPPIVEPPTAPQRLDTPEESPVAPDWDIAETVQQQPKPAGPAAQPPDAQSPAAQPPVQDSPHEAETQTLEELPPIQRRSLGTVHPNTETPTPSTEVTPVEPVAPRAISPQTDPASPPAQFPPKAAPSPPADVSTAGPSPSASPLPKTLPDRPSVASETPIQDGRSDQITGSDGEWERGKGEPEQPTLPTVYRVPLGQTASIVPLTRSADVDLSGMSTISPEPTPTKVSQTGETQSFLNPTEKTDPIQKRAAPQQFEVQQPDVLEGSKADLEPEPEPWIAQFNLEPPKSKTPASFLLPDRTEETRLPQIGAIEGETEETVAIKPPGELDIASQIPEGITVVSPFAMQQASSDEEQLEHLAQLMYGQLRSHLHQLHESRHGRAVPLATTVTAVWPLPLHQLATVVRQLVESRLRSDQERRPIHHR